MFQKFLDAYNRRTDEIAEATNEIGILARAIDAHASELEKFPKIGVIEGDGTGETLPDIGDDPVIVPSEYVRVRVSDDVANPREIIQVNGVGAALHIPLKDEEKRAAFQYENGTEFYVQIGRQFTLEGVKQKDGSFKDTSFVSISINQSKAIYFLGDGGNHLLLGKNGQLYGINDLEVIG